MSEIKSILSITIHAIYGAVRIQIVSRMAEWKWKGFKERPFAKVVYSIPPGVYHSWRWWSSASLGRLWCWRKIPVGDPGSQCHWASILEHPEENLLPWARPTFADSFCYQDDNASTHHATIVRVAVLYQPPLSPDCNPIEHLWDEIQCAMGSRDAKPQNLQELGQVLREEWLQWATTPA